MKLLDCFTQPWRWWRVEMLPHEQLLSVREVASRLGVCTSTIQELCAEGRLPHLRISNAIRVRPEVLSAARLEVDA